ncbi:MAG TPA: hypothetical protein VKB88_28930 [Bryobacteraceae bacterium]|nr:hypothetical protein [Bryobacteraceae bacterium]
MPAIGPGGKQKPTNQTPLLSLSVEEENLAAIPFAVLERRVGKKAGKIEINGAKTLPDGTSRRVVWQVQGHNELGLPTEQDLDIFVALGTLTFRNDFAKTVSFTGREIAKILGIGTVHGKFYKRLKLAMDRFIPLRFRALTDTEPREEVKWVNVFQEASFSLNRATGRCTGSITWTDKLIQSMDAGFFRLLDANRYMELDGITAKHLYRFLAIAFAKTDVVIMDARQLATEHLGILNPPKYLSRLMQTLEPAFEQLMHIQVLGSYQIVSSEDWRIALDKHASYVSERQTLQMHSALNDPEERRANCQEQLQRGGITAKTAAAYCEAASSAVDFYGLERCARVLSAMLEEEVLPHVAVSIVRNALEMGTTSAEGSDLLDWCEIAIHLCRQKRRTGRNLRNSAGWIVKISMDPSTRSRVVSPELASILKQTYRRQQEMAERQDREQVERSLILEYERSRLHIAETLFQDMPDVKKALLRKQKTEVLRQQERFQRIPPDVQEREIDAAILQELAKKEAPLYEKWRLRKQAQQAVLAFADPEHRQKREIA